MLVVCFIEEADDDAVSNTDKSADKYSLGNKNEIMMLHELCAKKGIKLEPEVGNKLTVDGHVDQSVVVVLEYEVLLQHCTIELTNSTLLRSIYQLKRLVKTAQKS